MRNTINSPAFMCAMSTGTSRVGSSDAQLLTALSSLLESERDDKYAGWLERYLRHETPSRGVRIPKIRAAVSQWYAKSGSDVVSLAPTRQRALAQALIALPTVEDKLAGTVLMQDELVPRELLTLGNLAELAYLFDEGHIHDWHCCDWFCVRVLSQFVRDDPLRAVPSLLEWHAAMNVWRARSSLVALLPVANDPRFYEAIADAAGVVVQREERFAKTAVGWLFCEIAKNDKTVAKRFVEDKLEHFSVEALRKVTKALSKRDGSSLLARLKSKA